MRCPCCSCLEVRTQAHSIWLLAHTQTLAAARMDANTHAHALQLHDKWRQASAPKNIQRPERHAHLTRMTLLRLKVQGQKVSLVCAPLWGTNISTDTCAGVQSTIQISETSTAWYPRDACCRRWWVAR